VPDAPRDVCERARLRLYLALVDAEAHLALDDVERLVVGVMDVRRGAAESGRHRELDERKLPAAVPRDGLQDHLVAQEQDLLPLAPGFMMTGLFVAMESSFGANGRSKCYVRAARAVSATLNTAAAINMSARSLVASAH